MLLNLAFSVIFYGLSLVDPSQVVPSQAERASQTTDIDNKQTLNLGSVGSLLIYVEPLPPTPDGMTGYRVRSQTEKSRPNDNKIVAFEILYELREKLDRDQSERLFVAINGLDFQFKRTSNGAWIHLPDQDESLLFENQLLGFAIERHPAWSLHWLTEPESRPQKQETLEKRLKEVLRFATLNNHLSFTRFPEPFAGVNPSFNVSIYAVQQPSPDPARKYLEQLLIRAQPLEVPQELSATKIGAVDGWTARMVVKGLVDGQSYPMTVDLWVATKDNLITFINAGYRQDDPKIDIWATHAKQMVASMRFL